MTQLRLKLLGGVQAEEEDGQAILVPSQKARALLAYLALKTGDTRPRRELANLLWGDRDECNAQNCLRQCIYRLRKVLRTHPTLLFSDGERLGCSSDALDLDIADFRRLGKAEDPEELHTAVRLYRGPLLDGLQIDEEAWNTWLLVERTRVHALACDIVRRAVTALSTQYPEKSIECLIRLIELEPFDEDAHRHLISLYAKTGNRGAALRHYEKCQYEFRQELGIELEDDTRSLRDTIIRDHTRPEQHLAPTPTPPSLSRSGLTRHRLSLEVLPFIVHEGKTSLESFGEVLTEDIVTKLTRYHTLSVTRASAGSTWHDQVETRYRLEGSVRLENRQLVARVFLSETASGTYFWASRFECPLDGHAEAYEACLTGTVSTLVDQLDRLEYERMRGRPMESLNAYELRVRGHDVWCLHTKASHIEARRIYRKSLAMDPDYSLALVSLAWTYVDDFRYVWSPKPFRALRRAKELAQRAVYLDPNSHSMHHLLGYIYMAEGRSKAADAAFQTALELNPNDADILPHWGLMSYREGKYGHAVERVQEAMRINPNYPGWYLWTLGNVYCETGAYEEAAVCFDQVGNPECKKCLVASYALRGHREEAVHERDAFLTSNPNFSLGLYAKVVSRTHPPTRLLQGLKESGLPQ